MMRESGFTVLELLVVLSISAILAGAASLRFHDILPEPSNKQLEWEAEHLMADIRYLRAMSRMDLDFPMNRGFWGYPNQVCHAGMVFKGDSYSIREYGVSSKLADADIEIRHHDFPAGIKAAKNSFTDLTFDRHGNCETPVTIQLVANSGERRDIIVDSAGRIRTKKGKG